MEKALIINSLFSFCFNFVVLSSDISMLRTIIRGLECEGDITLRGETMLGSVHYKCTGAHLFPYVKYCTIPVYSIAWSVFLAEE